MKYLIYITLSIISHQAYPQVRAPDVLPGIFLLQQIMKDEGGGNLSDVLKSLQGY